MAAFHCLRLQPKRAALRTSVYISVCELLTNSLDTWMQDFSLLLKSDSEQ